MLILSRDINEKIHIGSNIILTVVNVGGNFTQIKINGPEFLKVSYFNCRTEKSSDIPFFEGEFNIYKLLPGDCISLDDNTTISVGAIHKRQVKLGIAPPKDIPINREEIKGSKPSNPCTKKPVQTTGIVYDFTPSNYGFCFLLLDKSKSVHFTVSDITNGSGKDIKIGSSLHFTLIETNDGYKAKNIVIPEPA